MEHNAIEAMPGVGLTLARLRFEGKSVAVTGAGSGIGRAVAMAFAREGARVFLAGRSQKVEIVGRELNSQDLIARHYVGDLSREGPARRMVEECVRYFGGLDVLVNAAGIGGPGAVESISLSDWRSVLDHNLTNTFLCCREAIRVMKEGSGGAIVNVSSLAGRFRSGLGGAHYTASKAAIIGFTRHVAAEIARYKIRINVVCPGPTQTPMLVADARKLRRSLEAIRQVVPLGYISSPEEQARAILFLASDEASYITGAAVDVNGGIF